MAINIRRDAINVYTHDYLPAPPATWSEIVANYSASRKPVTISIPGFKWKRLLSAWFAPHSPVGLEAFNFLEAGADQAGPFITATSVPGGPQAAVQLVLYTAYEDEA